MTVDGPRRSFPLDGPYDLGRSLLLGRHADPTMAQLGPGQLLRASRTPEGPVSVAILQRGSELETQAWGPGAGWWIDNAATVLGLDDRPPRFEGRLGRLQRQVPGVRRTKAVDLFEVLANSVIRQRVAWRDARNSRLALLRSHAEPAPGPLNLRLPLSADQWRSLTTVEFAEAGVERKRATTILQLAGRAEQLREWAALPREEFAARLQSFPGIGPWTCALVLGHGLGELDVVPTGDYDLPSAVSNFLADEPRADDARMLELLEPYAGQRFRVLHLLWAAGVQAPRRGPRKRATSFR